MCCVLWIVPDSCDVQGQVDMLTEIPEERILDRAVTNLKAVLLPHSTAYSRNPHNVPQLSDSDGRLDLLPCSPWRMQARAIALHVCLMKVEQASPVSCREGHGHRINSEHADVFWKQAIHCAQQVILVPASLAQEIDHL